MAEPVILDNSGVNPCLRCAGDRQVAEMSWRSPMFSVTCLGCNQVIAGETDDEAVDAWNEANPERDVPHEEVHAMQRSMAKRMLTPDFLDTLQRMADMYGATPKAANVEPFIAWCQKLPA